MASQKLIGFVGLDELSLEVASSLVRHGYSVQAFETSDSKISELLKFGGIRCSSPKDAARDVAALVVLISHVDQASDLFFGNEGALKGLDKDAIVILHSTISPSLVHQLEKDLAEIQGVTYIVDAYISRGRSEASDGKVIITSSGKSDSIKEHSLFFQQCVKSFSLLWVKLVVAVKLN
ncbi:uncharacterized protein LOC129298331 [Prosopis cineraria]|uniref:uncharacterized protein LOC129298331 n=1 Tax=Prosopis cineraria TaxID=364024 RepID=UPI00240F1F64|nr:uncharacterized protein LOC129298331 [Prosopis cineraria]